MIISSIFRIVLAIILVLLGNGAVGITLGYLSGYASAVVLLSFILVTNLIAVKKESTIHLYHACKSILVASVPSWIPKVMGVVGAHLGTVLVFGTSGPSEAGSYFIAFAIFYAIDGIKTSLFSIAFPILSAMDDQRKRFVWRLIKMSLIVSLPISFSVMLYSNEVLGLIGSDYMQGSLPLKIILLSMLPLTFFVGISTLVYSYGNYWQVFSISLGSNMSRVLLYFILVPLYGSEGAAVAFTLGSVIGFVVSIIIAKRIGMLILWKELVLIFIIPAGLAFTLDYFHVIYTIGIPVILVLSLIFLRMSGVLSKSDVRESLGILPDSIGKPLINILNKL
jgi:O-antigen/teichoic acid export membrane protein